MRVRYGIVFVHGIVGNNSIFDIIVPMIPKGWTVRYVVLAGHGGNALGFSRASMDVWKKQVEDAVAEVGATCESVIGIGHSMGCLLLLEEAMQKRLSGLFLLNPPLRIRIKSRLFINSIKVALGMTYNDEVAMAAKNAYGISLDPNLLHYYGWPKRYVELFTEIRRVRKLLMNGIPCHVGVVLSCKDEMVSVSSEKSFINCKDVIITMLPESHHYHYSESDRNTIRDEFKLFLDIFL